MSTGKKGMKASGIWRTAGASTRRAFLVLAIALTVIAATARAEQANEPLADTYYYVNDNYTSEPGSVCTAVGNDANDGQSASTPKRNIQSLLDAYPNIGAGNTVWVDPGTFAENVTIGAAHSGLKLTGAGESSTVIDAEGSGVCLTLTSFASGQVSGFTLANGDAGAGDGGGMLVTGSSPTISDCTFNTNAATRGGGLANKASSNITISNCTFTNNSAENGGAMANLSSTATVSYCNFVSDTALYTGGSLHNDQSTVAVTFSVFDQNEAGAKGGAAYNVSCSPSFANTKFTSNSAAEGGAMYNDTSAATTITNCSLTLNTATDTASGAALHNHNNATPIVKNSILWGNTIVAVDTEIVSTGGASDTVTYSCVFGDHAGTGNIDSDPLFADAADGDLHLKSTKGRWDPDASDWVTDTEISPCIDAGDPADDYSEEPTRNGNRINMGAFGNTAIASQSDLWILTVLSTPAEGVPITGTYPDTTNYTAQVEDQASVTLIAPYTFGAGAFIQWLDDESAHYDYVASITFTVDTDMTFSAAYQAVSDFYVNDGTPEGGVAAGNDDNPGTTADAPMRNIQSLLDRYPDIGADVTLHVSTGTYSENVAIGSGHSNLVVLGDGAGLSIIDGGSAGTCLALDGFAGGMISDLKLQNGSAPAGGGVSCVNGSSPSISACIISSNEATGPNGGGGIYCNASSPTIQNCALSENVATDTDAYGGAISCKAGSQPVINRNFIRRNETTGDDSHGGGIALVESSATITSSIITGNRAAQHGGGIYCADSSPDIIGNSISGNRADEGAGIYVCEPAGTTVATVRNCILWDNEAITSGDQISVESSAADMTVSYSDVQGGEGAVATFAARSLTWGAGNIDADPLFSDPGEWDDDGTPGYPDDDLWVTGEYHLKSQAGRYDPDSEIYVDDGVTSPAIDAGDPADPYANEPDPNGGRVNMGGYGNTDQASKSLWYLTVQSEPVTGIPITGPPTDTTNYTAAVADSTLVSLSAPAAHSVGEADYSFSQWENGDGVILSDTVVLAVTVVEDTTVVAVYERDSWTLTVQSEPVTGIPITGPPTDTTNYTAYVDDQEAVALTAPGAHSVGEADYSFSQWENGDGVVLSDTVVLAFTVVEDTTVVAIYERDNWMLTVQSEPVTGIPITGPPTDTTNYTAQVGDEESVTLTAPWSFATRAFLRWEDGVGGLLTDSNVLSFTMDQARTVVAVYGGPCPVAHGVASVGGGWTWVSLPAGFTDPVVVAGPASRNDAEPGVLRLRWVQPNGFAVRFQEWDYLDGSHATEKVHWVAVDSGVYDLSGGKKMVAAKFWTNKTNPNAPRRVTLPVRFDKWPVVLAQVQTNQGTAAVTDRIVRVFNGMLALVMQEEEAGGTHGGEQIGYIALSQDTTAIGGVACDAKRSWIKLKHQPVWVGTALGGTQVFVEEEQSADTETDHWLAEYGGFLGLGGQPPYVADLQTCWANVASQDTSVLRCYSTASLALGMAGPDGAPISGQVLVVIADRGEAPQAIITSQEPVTLPCNCGAMTLLEAPGSIVPDGAEALLFSRWLVDGEAMPEGQTIIELKVSGRHTAAALYDPAE